MDSDSAMATTSTPSSPNGQYPKVVKYLTRKIKEETKVEDDVVVRVRYAKLREWFLDQFADKDRLNNDEHYLAEQRILAADTVTRMRKVEDFCNLPTVAVRLTDAGTCFESRKT